MIVVISGNSRWEIWCATSKKSHPFERYTKITWYGDSGGYKNVPFDSVNLHKHNIIMNIKTVPNRKYHYNKLISN